MIRIIIIALMFQVGACADLVYTAHGTLVGKIMDVRVKHSASKAKYSIKIDVKSTGVVRLMSGDQEEHHSSYGFVRSGEYHAKEYKIDKTYKGIRYIKRYIFDYKKKKITKISKKWKNGKKLYDRKETLGYFAHNDILTLYHNIMKFKKTSKPGRYSIMLAGAEKEGGRVAFEIPSGKRVEAEKKLLGLKDIEVVVLYMKRAFMSGNNGALVFGIDKNGIMEKGILKDVKLLGKVTLKRVR